MPKGKELDCVAMKNQIQAQSMRSQPLRVRIAGAGIFILMCLLACNINTFIPDEEHLRSWLGFLRDGSHEYEGMYANSDVDCFIFKVYVNDPSLIEGNLMNHYHAKLLEEGWIKFKDGWYANRIDSNNRLTGNTADIVRIEPFGEGKLLLGFLQIDHVKGNTIEEVLDESGEAVWARRWLWPRFEKLLKQIRNE